MNRILALFTCVVLAIGFGASPQAAEKEYIGDESDGSRSAAVHKIPLLDEDGVEIKPGEEPAVPFSVRQTCALKCHQYEAISGGWHFNAAAPDIPAGRAGHPWIWADARTATQLPLSYRSWPGAYRPADAGVTDWQFVLRFGHHLPGGGPGEMPGKNDAKTVMRQMVSGKLEANCLACHDTDPAHDQAEYAGQIARQNFRWAAASTSSFAAVSGSAKDMPDTYDYLMPEPPDDPKIIPPQVAYRESVFDEKNAVFFPVTRKVPNTRCYFCHSVVDTQSGTLSKGYAEEDVHIAAGMQCVDCHRNDAGHRIVRGYEGESQDSPNPLADRLTCRGCHLGTEGSEHLTRGRMSAPVPEHKGIPPIHFEKMACTACHAGPWPEAQPHRFKTSLAHGLGLHNVDKSPAAPPAVFGPVFARDEAGKIAPQYGLWPSFWGRIQDQKVTPLSPLSVQEAFADFPLPEDGNLWPALTETEIASRLQALAALASPDGKPVYATGGILYQLDESGQIEKSAQEQQAPCLWPMSHAVRPAAQSLGVRGCTDCHSPESPFFEGRVPMSPMPSGVPELTLSMTEFQDLDAAYMSSLSQTFLVRPWFKATMGVLAFLLASLAAVYLSRGVDRVLSSYRKQP